MCLGACAELTRPRCTSPEWISSLRRHSPAPLGVFAVLLHIFETLFTKDDHPAPARLRTERSNKTSGFLGLLWELCPKRRSVFILVHLYRFIKIIKYALTETVSIADSGKRAGDSASPVLKAMKKITLEQNRGK